MSRITPRRPITAALRKAHQKTRKLASRRMTILTRYADQSGCLLGGVRGTQLPQLRQAEAPQLEYPKFSHAYGDFAAASSIRFQ
jgi:hypothetical protein